MRIEIVVTHRHGDRSTLERVFLQSRGLERATLVVIENTEPPTALPTLFNAHKRTATADWLIFVHDDFLVFDPGWLERVLRLPPDACYGPIGIDRYGRFLGRIRQTDGSCLGEPAHMAEVQGLDEMCLILPREIYSRTDFDERFAFDFYAHDYCLETRRRGFAVRVVQLDCQHRSKALTGAVDSPRYLNAKRLFIDKHQGVRPLVTTTFQLMPRYWADVVTKVTARVELELIPAGSTVLEIGPGPGRMTEALRAKGCRISAVEVDPDLAALARSFSERIIIGDVERLDLESELAGARFNVILLGDVLEHLRDPGGLLQRLKDFLEPDGFLVVSIPNVAHASVRLLLLAGKFDYRDEGLLDASHLRFFTLETIVAMFRRAGWEIRDLHRTHVGVLDTEIHVDAEAVPLAVLRRLCRDPETTSYQFVFRAVLAGESEPTTDERGAGLSDPGWSARGARTELARAYFKLGRRAFWTHDMRSARKLFSRSFGLAPASKTFAYIVASGVPFAISRLIRRLKIRVSTARRPRDPWRSPAPLGSGRRTS